jgi:hypothetical protein
MEIQHEESFEKELVTQMQLFVYRNPKKDHDPMVNLQKEFRDLFTKLGDSPRYEVFHLDNFESPMDGISNIAKVVSANQDEEVWVEILSYKNLKHLKEYCEKCKRDESMSALYQNFMNLITPTAGFVMGDFSRTSGY